jgi:hypothetical protein
MAPSFDEVPWNRLRDEFALYDAEPHEAAMDHEPFVKSLAIPSPPFVGYLLAARVGMEREHGSTVRDLYFYLLKKRYEERLNFLHFAFNIFDDATCLSKEVIDQTPFPHEDGFPKFGDFRILDLDPQAPEVE